MQKYAYFEAFSPVKKNSVILQKRLSSQTKFFKFK